MSNLILIDRKNKKQVVCETRRGGAEVQLPPAGTGLDLTFATGTQAEELLIGNSPAPGGACGTGLSSMGRERLVLAPGINKQQGGRSWSARRVHAPEVAGSNPAPATWPRVGRRRVRERQVRDGNASRFHVCNVLARRPGFKKSLRYRLKQRQWKQKGTVSPRGHVMTPRAAGSTPG